METAATLLKAGIPVALQSGFEGYVPKTRVVLFEAAEAASNGLSFEQALATVTIGAARILGIAGESGLWRPVRMETSPSLMVTRSSSHPMSRLSSSTA
jgi:imidazolonepropionase-like amidohydrolase